MRETKRANSVIKPRTSKILEKSQILLPPLLAKRPENLRKDHLRCIATCSSDRNVQIFTNTG